jgi:hypothetical protein
MRTPGRILMMAEMHGRDLLRRPAALALLVALPLGFYLSSGRTGRFAVTAGGVGLAFAIAGATLFSTLSSADVDQRLVLGGYRPFELLVGRLLFLGPLALVIAAGFSVLMIGFAGPETPWLVFLGVAVVGLQSVPLGLAVGAGVARELEGTLVVIGVVGIQMAADPGSAVAKVLPFHEPQQLIIAGVDGHGPVLAPLLWTLLYGAALLTLARVFLIPRLDVAVHRARAEQGASQERGP